MSFIYTYLYILWFFPLSYTPPFWSCLCWASLSRKSVWETNKKVHWLNIQSDTEARVRSRTRTHARTHTVWKRTSTERWMVRVPVASWCESQGTRACACTHTYGKMFGHSFRSHPPPMFVCGCMRERRRLQSRRREVWKVQKRRLPLNQQQLFGTFNIY